MPQPCRRNPAQTEPSRAACSPGKALVRGVIAAAIALPVLTGCAPDRGPRGAADASAPKPMQLDDRTFVQTAGSSGMYEVEASRLALTTAGDADVRAFAQQMIQDHTRANQELVAVARQAGIQPPAGMNAKHYAMYQALQGERGAAFDRQYVEQQVMAHEEAVSLFAAAARQGDDPQLRAFATRTHPTLQEHLQMARGLAR